MPATSDPSPAPPPSRRKSEAAPYLSATLVVAVGMVAGAALQWIPAVPSPWRWLPFGVAYLVGGGPILRDTLRTLRHGRLSIDFLMGTAALGAAAVGQPFEGVVLIFLFSLSNTLERYAMGRTRREIEALMDLHPEEATLVDASGKELGQIASADLTPGQRFLVRPGERIAADGRVREGRSEVNQAAITGESIPVTRLPGDDVFAGTINESGALQVEVTKPAGDTMLARIVRMVEEAREKRAPTQEFIDRFAHPYTLAVVAGSFLTALVAWGIFGYTPNDAVYRAMTFLVVASPCALVISTPAAVLSAIANGARHGILFKGGEVMDRAGSIRAVAFDKTGTLTVGSPQLLATHPVGGVSEEELIRLAAGVESSSEHHLARALMAAAKEKGIEAPSVAEFRAIAGEGVEGRLDGRWIWVGNDAMARRRSLQLHEELELWRETQGDLGRSVVLIGDEGRILGLMAFGDSLRSGAAAALQRLRKECGIQSITVLSGDNPRAVRAIAAELGADEVLAGLLPDEKVDALAELTRRWQGVAMVGDGVNDAPAMAAATLGVAMGAVGTDVAIETADIVLMSDELRKIPYLLLLGRRSRRVVRQNVWFSVSWMGLLVLTASTVGIPLPVAVVAHEGSTLLVVLNGLRLLRGRGEGEIPLN